MSVLLAMVIGVLYGCGVWMLLRRGFIQLIFGLALISHGANLLLFSSGGLTRALPPIVPPGEQAMRLAVADPLAQALILTAIVIGFGVLSFFVLLARHAQEVLRIDDSDKLPEDR